MLKEPRGVWITCSRRLEPVYAPLRNGKAHCTVCGEMWPTNLEGEVAEEPPSSSKIESDEEVTAPAA